MERCYGIPSRHIDRALVSESVRDLGPCIALGCPTPSLCETGINPVPWLGGVAEQAVCLPDRDRSGHAFLRVGAPVTVLDVAMQIAEISRRNRYKPPFRGAAGIDLDLADHALDFRLGPAGVDHLNFSRMHALCQTRRSKIMLDAARVGQHQLVELARLESQITGCECVCASRGAEFHPHLHWRLFGQITGGEGRGREPGETRQKTLDNPFRHELHLANSQQGLKEDHALIANASHLQQRVDTCL